MRSLLFSFFVLVFIFFSLFVVQGPDWVAASLAESKLTASDAASYAFFARAVAASDQVMLVGASQESASASHAGAAYVYRLNGSTWQQEQKLLAYDGTFFDYFGTSVAIDQNVALIGAPKDSPNGDESGSAYLFRWNGSTWQEEAKLIASDGAAFDLFAHAVSISGDVALIGAPDESDNGYRAGAAHIYRWNGSTWQEEAKLIAYDTIANDHFGHSVSVSGNLALVGAYGDDDGGSTSGSAYLFRWNGSTWQQEAKLIASDAARSDAFGYSVSLDGDVALIGAYGASFGAAYLFRYNGGKWVQLQKLTANDGASADYFGYSVSIDDNLAVIGAYRDDDHGSESGSAYVYRSNGCTWSQESKLTASDGAARDYFAYTVAVNNNRALIGAYGDNDHGTDSGSAYLYDLSSSPTSCTATPTATPSSTATATRTATATSTSSPTLTHTPSPSATGTSTPTFTPSPSATGSTTATHTPSPSATGSTTATHTPSPSATGSTTATATHTATVTQSATASPTVTGTPPTSTPTVTGTPPTSTPTITATITTPTSTPTSPPGGSSLARLFPHQAVANAGNLPVMMSMNDSALLARSPVSARLGTVELLSVTIESATEFRAIIPVGSLSEGTHTLTIEQNGEEITQPNAFTVTSAVNETAFRVLVYLPCENNLISTCHRIFNTLELAASNQNARIITFWDENGKNNDGYYFIQKDENPFSWAAYGPSDRHLLGEIDSADPQTLAQFAAWAQSRYPAQYDYLIIAGHGGGWASDLYPIQKEYSWAGGVAGLLWDDGAQNSMSTTQLAKALAMISQANPLDLLYLDAHLMSSVEVMAELAPHAKRIMAHENLTGANYAYDEQLALINESSTPSALAQQITQLNRDAWAAAGQAGQMSVIKSANLDPLLTDVALLTRELSATLELNRSPLHDLLLKTARVEQNHDGQLNTQDSTLDLYDFAQQLHTNATLPTSVKNAAQKVMNTLEAAVEINQRQNGVPYPALDPWQLDNLHGLSLYFPLTDEWKRPYYGPDALPRFAAATGWTDFIQAWYDQQNAPPAPTDACSDCPTPPMPVALSLVSDKEDIDVGETAWLTVSLHGAEQADDMRGIQFTVESSDQSILAPAGKLDARLGPIATPATSRTVDTTDTGWGILLRSDNDLFHGTGSIIEIPFTGQAAGCVDVTFTQHLLMNNQPQPQAINHHANQTSICVGDTVRIDGQILLESRLDGLHDSTQISLSGPNDLSAATTTDAEGRLRFNNLVPGSYDLQFKRENFLSSETSVAVAGRTTQPPNILCAGDINNDGHIDQRDNDMMAVGIIPVSFPRYDLNGDNTTNIADFIILGRNLGKSAPTTCGGDTTTMAQTRHQQPSERASDDHATRSSTHSSATTGARITLPAGATVTHIEPLYPFTDAFLDWQQVDDTLYLVTRLPEGINLPKEGIGVRIHLTPAAKSSTCAIKIDAIKQHGWQGDFEVISNCSHPLYLPLIRQ